MQKPYKYCTYDDALLLQLFAPLVDEAQLGNARQLTCLSVVQARMEQPTTFYMRDECGSTYLYLRSSKDVAENVAHADKLLQSEGAQKLDAVSDRLTYCLGSVVVSHVELVADEISASCRPSRSAVRDSLHRCRPRCSEGINVLPSRHLCLPQ